MNTPLNHLSRLLPVVTAIGMFSLSTLEAGAEPIVKVDFGAQAGDTSPLLEDGFLAAFWQFAADSTPLASESLSLQHPDIPSGTLELTLGSNVNFASAGGNMNMRRRAAPADSGAFTYGELLKDRVVSIGGDGLYLRLSGLTPNTEFQIQVWGYDNAKPGNFELLDRTAGKNLSLGSFGVISGTLPATNDDFSVLASVFSDENGTIIVQSKSNIDGTGIMNGFVLSVVPEPATAVTLLGGLGVLVTASRFRRQR